MGAHTDLWTGIASKIHNLQHIRWIRAHLSKEQALHQGYTEMDWEGNSRADAAAKEGAAGHGYTPDTIRSVRDRASLVCKVQNHLVNTYISYLNQYKFEDEIKHNRKAKAKARAKGECGKRKVGRPKKRPEDMGHEVQCQGGKQFCLKCGRSTGSATKHSFWIGKPCFPTGRYQKFCEKGHDLSCDWDWYCRKCGVRGQKLASTECVGISSSGRKRTLSGAGRAVSSKRLRGTQEVPPWPD